MKYKNNVVRRWILLLLAIAISGISRAESLPGAEPKAEGFLLIAHERMVDPRFKESVLLMTKYGADGTMGVMINRPTEIPLSDVLPRIEALNELRNKLFVGGPVSRQVLIILFESDVEPKAEGFSRVFDNVYVGMSNAALAEVFRQKRPVFKIYSGFAGWAPGQLEREIDRGDWLLGKATAATIFKKEPTHIWPDITGHPRPLPRDTIQARTAF